MNYDHDKIKNSLNSRIAYWYLIKNIFSPLLIEYKNENIQKSTFQLVILY